MEENLKHKLKDVGKWVLKGLKFKKALEIAIPSQTVWILRCYDTRNYNVTTEEASFYEDKIRKLLVKNEKVKEPGFSDQYYIISGSVKELLENKIYDNRAGEYLEEKEKETILDKLRTEVAEVFN